MQTDGELADTTTVPAALELRDEEGNVFTPQYVSLESDSSANVTLTVYQVRELPAGQVDFISARRTALTSRVCNYSLSQQTTAWSPGPARTIERAGIELTVTRF